MEPLRVVRYAIYHSPNAYLGAVHLNRLLGAVEPELQESRSGPALELVRRPLHVPRSRGVLVADLVGGRETARHGGYYREDCRRWADRHGVPLQFTPGEEFAKRRERWADSEFEREELPARVYYASEGSGREAALDLALYEAAFVGVRDVNDEDVVRSAVARAGLDPDEMLARARSREMGARARQALAEFDALDGPGVPLFVVEGERFWGKDRVETLLERVRERLRVREQRGS